MTELSEASSQMALLLDVLRANGGIDRWRQMRRYTLHLSIGGELSHRKNGAARLKELVVEGSLHEQSLELLGFTAPDRRALYDADGVALEGADGRRLQERHGTASEFRAQLRSSSWDELQLAHYCGYLLWNYVNVPFILSEADFHVEELESIDVQGETWRRLRAQFPARVVTHAAEQVFHFDRDGRLRRLDYVADFEEGLSVTQLLSGHQEFSGIVVPTLSRILSSADEGVWAKSPLLDVEIFDAVFE
jgi:hypothetical protein